MATGAVYTHPDTIYVTELLPGGTDTLGRSFIVIQGDTMLTSFLPDVDAPKHTGPLTDEDYAEAAAYLGVDPAAIRAVVEVEAGRAHLGFNDGKPIINFDQTVFRNAAARRGINLSKYAGNEALKPLNVKKYGSHQAAMHARLEDAYKIDTIAAIDGTFWGMFQIGGFTYKLCGLSSRDEFVRLMSRSEYDQLMLFTVFIEKTGYVKYLRNKDWATFARRYNGPSYAARGYHTKLARAYRRYGGK